MNIELNKITLRIISKILFGRDFNNINKCTYISPKDHSVQELSFEDCYFKYAKEGFEAQFSLIGNMLPAVANSGIIDPFKTINQNKQTLEAALEDFWKCSTDPSSTYNRVKASSVFSEFDLFKDMVSLLYAAYDTSSHGIGSTLYFLHKYPETLGKLTNELKICGIIDLDPSVGSDLKDIYENWDYLNNSIKEGLRIDPPLAGSLFYSTTSDVKIWGVPMPKGTLINLHNTMLHHNPEIYAKPNEFVPERFDPESEHYFKRSDDGKDPRSYIPFSFGLRSCAGQSLAKLEMKVIVSRILTLLKIEFEEDMLKNDYLRFSVVNHTPLKAKFLQKI